MLEARDRVGGRVWSVSFGDEAIVERGAEFILPGYDVMKGLAERFGIPLVLKGTPYGRSSLRRRGEPCPRPLSRPPSSGSPRARQRTPRASPTRSRRSGSDAARRGADPHPGGDLQRPSPDDLAASVLEEGASTFGDFDNYTLEGGNMRLAEALAAELGDALHLSSPVRRVRWSQGAVDRRHRRRRRSRRTPSSSRSRPPRWPRSNSIRRSRARPPRRCARSSTARTRSSSCACARRRRRARSCPWPGTSGPTRSSTRSGEPRHSWSAIRVRRTAIDALGGRDGAECWVARRWSRYAGTSISIRNPATPLSVELARRSLGARLLLGAQPLIADPRRETC